eukprot:CAMPEP_0202364328 /NCGR_PEP_ID=MMETSP1126-20121109/15775_1 /ASSEMBLY_ACC=CAM_ASM_000457 /TAXON_ID=3047 /ORGANISM="Dunaliella tertiolecta, Strain CCMP1320" /LENGTH=78 /DNA_ID=CAMNT_0048958939 /DNA_START=975 /DNA_END=1211 /DNA_ORIENTATION=-
MDLLAIQQRVWGLAGVMAFILASGPAAAAAAAVAVTAAAATAQLAASAQEVLDPCTIITAAVITLAVHRSLIHAATKQ